MTLPSSIFQIGPRITAQVLGQPFTQYRPASATNPIATPFATIPVWVTADAALKGMQPFKREKPDERYAGLDPALTQVGDYLIGADVAGGTVKTFFIADQNVPAPIRLVECSRIFNFTRPPAPATGLNVGYGGRTKATDTPLLTGWPGSCVQGTKGEAGPPANHLPGDARLPWWTVLLPAWPGVTLEMGDHATDDLGRNYTVSSAELTNFGWRLTMMLSST